MEVVRAKTAGFCMGVSLALQKLDDTLQHTHLTGDGRVCTLGPIIHNPQVLEKYRKLGVHCLESASEASTHDYIVVRAHGITRQEEELLKQRAAHIIDATCPKVKKAQLSIAKATMGGRTLLLFGEENHPEVRGLVSYAHQKSYVFDSFEKLKAFTFDEAEQYVLASQTTQDGRIFLEIEKFLRNQIFEIPVLSTICNATHQRQEEIKHIAKSVDAVVVVGGKQSGNTCRLVDVAASEGVPTWHVETVHELEKDKFSLFSRLALTAGASTPKELIDAVEHFLQKM